LGRRLGAAACRHAAIRPLFFIAIARQLGDTDLLLFRSVGCGHLGRNETGSASGGDRMIWIKPEFKEVAVTLEVTAYAGRK
jgi:coenzyme PQQ precursor peptide PqqA